jgi:cytohesin
LVSALIDGGLDVHLTDSEGHQPLHWAAYCGHTDVVNVLMSNNADPVAISNCGKTPIHFAISKNRTEVLRIFLDHDVRITIADTREYTALNAAMSENTEAAVQMLQMLSKAVSNYDPLMNLNYFAAQGDILSASHVFEKVKQSAISSDENWLFEDLFSWALERGITPLVKSMIDEDIGRLGQIITYGSSNPLGHAAERGHLDIVLELISRGAEIEAIDRGGLRALHSAARSGVTEVVLALLDNGADPGAEETEDSKRLPLHFALEGRHVETSLLILERSSSIGLTWPAHNRCQYLTPLHLAAQNGLETVAIQLISRGHTVNIQDPAGRYPLHLAAESGQNNIVVALLQADAEIDPTSEECPETPLHFAALSNQKEVVMTLISWGANLIKPSAVDSINALGLAARGGHKDVVIAILEEGGTGLEAALDEATTRGHTDVVEELERRKARVDGPDMPSTAVVNTPMVRPLTSLAPSVRQKYTNRVT